MLHVFNVAMALCLMIIEGRHNFMTENSVFSLHAFIACWLGLGQFPGFIETIWSVTFRGRAFSEFHSSRKLIIVKRMKFSFHKKLTTKCFTITITILSHLYSLWFNMKLNHLILSNGCLALITIIHQNKMVVCSLGKI